MYCSNVIEHIDNPVEFCRNLCDISEKYIVIQAPYNERHEDGNILTSEKPIDEHINTIDESLIQNIAFDIVDWSIKFNDVPVAWNKGRQIYFIGKKKAV